MAPLKAGRMNALLQFVRFGGGVLQRQMGKACPTFGTFLDLSHEDPIFVAAAARVCAWAKAKLFISISSSSEYCRTRKKCRWAATGRQRAQEAYRLLGPTR